MKTKIIIGLILLIAIVAFVVVCTAAAQDIKGRISGGEKPAHRRARFPRLGRRADAS